MILHCHPPMHRPYHILLVTCLLLISSNEATVRSESCQPFQCGNTTYSYPFWHNNGTNEYCGYPSFGITCSDDEERVLLHLSGNDYYVQSIDYNTKTFIAIDADVAEGPCPRVTKNVSLDDYHQLSFADTDRFLHFFFNCSPPQEQILRFSSLSCFNYKCWRSFVFINGTYPPGLPWDWGCMDNVLAPVYGELSSLINSFDGLLQGGFRLRWTSALGCTACEETKGYCAYRNLSGVMRFGCFCDDGFHIRTCNDGGKSRKGDRGVIIGVVAGGIGGMAAIFAVVTICYRRRKRLVKASSVLLARNITPDGSSNYDLEKSIGKSMNYPTHVFAYQELEEATNNFDSSNELGDGGFGTVYYGKLKDGRSVAVKRLYENNLRRVEQFLNEVQILSTQRHQNLVTLYGCTSRHSRELLLVYEFIPNGTVADHLHGSRAQSGGLTWPVRVSIAVETAEALAYLHAVDPPIIHRDVKTNNILLDNNYRVKVADFGLSRLFPLDATHISTTPQGTPGYLDPDYHKCYQLTDKSDVYSFGVVLAELISSKPAVDITRHRHDINLANMAISKIRSGALDEFVDLSLEYNSDYKVKKAMTYMAEVAFRCLGEEKDDRPSMDEVVTELKRIERGELHGHGIGSTEESGDHSPREDVGLLKNIPPPSPDSVMDPWLSNITTPNTSS